MILNKYCAAHAKRFLVFNEVYLVNYLRDILDYSCKWLVFKYSYRCKGPKNAFGLILTGVNPLEPAMAAAGHSVQSWNGRRRPHTGPTIKKKSWQLTTELNATKFCYTLADTFCNNISALRAWVAVFKIGFVYAISKIFISIFFMTKYGVT